MMIWSTIWEAVKAVGNVVGPIVGKVFDVLTHDKFEKIYDRLDRLIMSPKESERKSRSNAPDFYKAQEVVGIEKKLAAQSNRLVKHESDLANSKKIFALQIELARLRTSADVIDRATQNAKMHASNLLVHYQNMRNVRGLVDDVNALRHAVHMLIDAVNYNADEGKLTGIHGRRVDGVDIEKRPGAISHLATFDAFDRTRALLLSEIEQIAIASDRHLVEVEIMKTNAAELGGDLGSRIIEFVEGELEPVIRASRKGGDLLRTEVRRLPAAMRDKQGRLLLQEGRISLTNNFQFRPQNDA